jgi:hypothetical protein
MGHLRSILGTAPEQLRKYLKGTPKGAFEQVGMRNFGLLAGVVIV